MIVNEVNKFGQIFPIHRRRDENARIWGNFHPFDFTPKSHLRRIILCQGYFTFFSKLISESPCMLGAPNNSMGQCQLMLEDNEKNNKKFDTF
jgi:hypothetical protein